MLLDYILKLLGVKNDIKYSAPVFDFNGPNVVHAEHKNKKELDDLYDEIRVLQAKNREKINKNKITYNISK